MGDTKKCVSLWETKWEDQQHLFKRKYKINLRVYLNNNGKWSNLNSTLLLSQEIQSEKKKNIALLKGTKGDIERQREMRQNEIINAGGDKLINIDKTQSVATSITTYARGENKK